MRLTVNGEVRDAEEGLTLRAFLESLELNPAKVAVERNLAIVPKSRYGATVLAAGDRLEIVEFVGGG
jgi:thiamine biosynthesis protein ThiS